MKDEKVYVDSPIAVVSSLIIQKNRVISGTFLISLAVPKLFTKSIL